MPAFMTLERIPYVLETERLALRAYDPSDERCARDLFRVVAEDRADLSRWAAWPDTWKRLEDVTTWVRGARAKFESMTGFAWGIHARDDGRLVGGSGMHPRGQPETISFEIGYWLRSTERGKGYAREVTRALARAAIELGKTQRVVIRAQVDNTRSRRVPESLGFTFEGIARAGIRIREEPRDLAMYSLLPEEIGRLDG
jgi:RimJ/RimL family protein N-acetyltransferase